MRRFAIRSSCLMVLAMLPMSGCIIVASIDGWGDGGACIWVDGEEERVSLDTAGLRGLDVQTHNGAVSVEGSSAGDSYVVYRARAGARTLDGAREALDAVEVFLKRDANGVERIGWRWNVPKRRSWSASVSFDIRAPEGCDVKVRTHNGRVTATSVVGIVDVETHNGSVTIQSTGDSLRAQTHNGKIDATFAGREVKLGTHNGRIVADVSGCGALDGRIVTHNGSVRVTLGAETSMVVRASTHNGGIKCAVPLEESTIERRTLRGRIGGGDGALTISTHNGGIRIERGDG